MTTTGTPRFRWRNPAATTRLGHGPPALRRSGAPALRHRCLLVKRVAGISGGGLPCRVARSLRHITAAVVGPPPALTAGFVARRSRRSRLAAARPAAAAATAAALTLAGGTLPAAASGGGAIDAAASPAARSGVLGRPDARVVGTSLAGCGDAHTPASNPRHFVDVRGKLFFTASDGVHGAELWTSDGTKAGTVLVKDITRRTTSTAPTAPNGSPMWGAGCSSPPTTASTGVSCGPRTA